MDRLYEYTGMDLINIISKDAYQLVCAVGNHEYSDYEGLKLLIRNIIFLEPDNISIIVESLIDLDLRSLEKVNPLASMGYNKRIHDFCSIICALNDSGYNFDSDKFSSKMFKIRGNLIIKNNSRLDIMIDNPVCFKYEKNENSISFNKQLKSSEKINGLELCNLMFYIGTNKYERAEDVLKHGNFVKEKNSVKVLK